MGWRSWRARSRALCQRATLDMPTAKGAAPPGRYGGDCRRRGCSSRDPDGPRAKTASSTCSRSRSGAARWASCTGLADEAEGPAERSYAPRPAPPFNHELHSLLHRTGRYPGHRNLQYPGWALRKLSSQAALATIGVSNVLSAMGAKSAFEASDLHRDRRATLISERYAPLFEIRRVASLAAQGIHPARRQSTRGLG